MTREEMARAYADGYNKEYQQIAYDAFLCGYGAKCESVVSEELEEAAKDRVTENGRFPISEFEELRIRDIKFGAEWQKVQDQKTIELAEDHAMLAGMNKMEQQMMEKAVEGKVFMSFAPGHNQMVMADVDLPTNTKVKVIIVKEDEK